MDQIIDDSIAINYQNSDKDHLIHIVTHIDLNNVHQTNFSLTASRILTSRFNAAFIKKNFQISCEAISMNYKFSFTVRENKYVCTFLDSKYSAGSFSVLIQGKFGTALYTGYFSYYPEFSRTAALAPLLHKRNALSTLYLDGTYYEQPSTFLGLDENIKKVVELIRLNRKRKVYIYGDKFYVDPLLCELATRLKERMYVDNNRREVMQFLGCDKYFTSDANEARIFISKGYVSKREPSSDLHIVFKAHPDYSDKFQPSGLYTKLNVYYVHFYCHSNHKECCRLISELKPEHLVFIHSPSVDTAKIKFAEVPVSLFTSKQFSILPPAPKLQGEQNKGSSQSPSISVQKNKTNETRTKPQIPGMKNLCSTQSIKKLLQKRRGKNGSSKIGSVPKKHETIIKDSDKPLVIESSFSLSSPHEPLLNKMSSEPEKHETISKDPYMPLVIESSFSLSCPDEPPTKKVRSIPKKHKGVEKPVVIESSFSLSSHEHPLNKMRSEPQKHKTMIKDAGMPLVIESSFSLSCPDEPPPKKISSIPEGNKKVKEPDKPMVTESSFSLSCPEAPLFKGIKILGPEEVEKKLKSNLESKFKTHLDVNVAHVIEPKSVIMSGQKSIEENESEEDVSGENIFHFEPQISERREPKSLSKYIHSVHLCDNTSKCFDSNCSNISIVRFGTGLSNKEPDKVTVANKAVTNAITTKKTKVMNNCDFANSLVQKNPQKVANNINEKSIQHTEIISIELSSDSSNESDVSHFSSRDEHLVTTSPEIKSAASISFVENPKTNFKKPSVETESSADGFTDKSSVCNFTNTNSLCLESPSERKSIIASRESFAPDSKQEPGCSYMTDQLGKWKRSIKTYQPLKCYSNPALKNKPKIIMSTDTRPILPIKLGTKETTFPKSEKIQEVILEPKSNEAVANIGKSGSIIVGNKQDDVSSKDITVLEKRGNVIFARRWTKVNSEDINNLGNKDASAFHLIGDNIQTNPLWANRPVYNGQDDKQWKHVKLVNGITRIKHAKGMKPSVLNVYPLTVLVKTPNGSSNRGGSPTAVEEQNFSKPKNKCESDVELKQLIINTTTKSVNHSEAHCDASAGKASVTEHVTSLKIVPDVSDIALRISESVGKLEVNADVRVNNTPIKEPVNLLEARPDASTDTEKMTEPVRHLEVGPDVSALADLSVTEAGSQIIDKALESIMANDQQDIIPIIQAAFADQNKCKETGTNLSESIGKQTTSVGLEANKSVYNTPKNFQSPVKVTIIHEAELLNSNLNSSSLNFDHFSTSLTDLSNIEKKEELFHKKRNGNESISDQKNIQLNLEKIPVSPKVKLTIIQDPKSRNLNFNHLRSFYSDCNESFSSSGSKKLDDEEKPSPSVISGSRVVFGHEIKDCSVVLDKDIVTKYHFESKYLKSRILRKYYGFTKLDRKKRYNSKFFIKYSQFIRKVLKVKLAD